MTVYVSSSSRGNAVSTPSQTGHKARPWDAIARLKIVQAIFVSDLTYSLPYSCEALDHGIYNRGNDVCAPGVWPAIECGHKADKGVFSYTHCCIFCSCLLNPPALSSQGARESTHDHSAGPQECSTSTSTGVLPR